MLFGTEPPLYSKPAGYTPPPVPQPGSLAAANGSLGVTGGYGPGVAGYNPMYPGQQQHGSYQQQQAGMGQYPGLGAGSASSMDAGAMHQHTNSWAGLGAYAASSQQQQPLDRPQQPHQQPQQQPPPQKPEPPGAATQRQLQADFRALALGALASRLQTASEAYNKHAAGEMERLLNVQRQLADRDQELQRVVSGCGWRYCVMPVCYVLLCMHAAGEMGVSGCGWHCMHWQPAAVVCGFPACALLGTCSGC